MYRLRAFFFGVNFRSLPPATVTRLRQLGLKLSPPALSRVAQDSDAKGFAQGASDELANADFIDRSRGAELFAHAQRSFDGKNRRKSTVPLLLPCAPPHQPPGEYPVLPIVSPEPLAPLGTAGRPDSRACSL
jgi:hypothetical protein